MQIYSLITQKNKSNFPYVDIFFSNLKFNMTG